MIIHQMWIGPPMPDWMFRCIDSWHAHHPDWEFRFYGETELYYPPKTWKNWRLIVEAEQISPNAPEQFRSDVARYEILHQYGGVWVDTDMACLKPIDELFTPLFLGWEVQDVWANNALLGAEAGHPFLAEAIERLPDRVRSHRGQSNGVMSGPQFITPLARKHEATIYPQHYFYPYSYKELHRHGEEYPDSYAVHHWANKRRQRNQPL